MRQRLEDEYMAGTLSDTKNIAKQSPVCQVLALHDRPVPLPPAAGKETFA